MIFSEPREVSITVPNFVGGLATLNTERALQANFQLDGAGELDFAGGEWEIDVALSVGSSYVPYGVTINSPKMVPLAMPAANYRLRCTKAPSDISKTPRALLVLR